MYCSSCGKQLPDNSVFCSECGSKCGNNGVTSIPKYNNHKNYLNFILETLKHPVSIMKNDFEGISVRFNLILTGIITLLIPFINVISIKQYSFNLIKSFFEITSKIKGNSFDFKDAMDFKDYFDKLISTNFPTGNIYFAYLLNYILSYGLIILITYLVYKVLMKKTLTINDTSRILVVFSIFKLVFLILIILLLNIGIIPTLLIRVFGNIFTLILLFVGFNNLLDDENKYIYIFTIAYLIAFVISLYVTIKYSTSIIASFGINNLNTIMNYY